MSRFFSSSNSSSTSRRLPKGPEDQNRKNQAPSRFLPDHAAPPQYGSGGPPLPSPRQGGGGYEFNPYDDNSHSRSSSQQYAPPTPESARFERNTYDAPRPNPPRQDLPQSMYPGRSYNSGSPRPQERPPSLQPLDFPANKRPDDPRYRGTDNYQNTTPGPTFPISPPPSAQSAPQYRQPPSTPPQKTSPPSSVSNQTSPLGRSSRPAQDFSSYGLTQAPSSSLQDDFKERQRIQGHALEIAGKIEHDKTTKSVKLGNMMIKGSEKLSSAQKLVEKVISDDTFKTGKDVIQALLEPAKDVAAILEFISEIHPFISAATKIFKVVIKLETDRQDNDKNIVVIHYTMTDLLFVLAYLEPVFSTADKLQSILEKYLHNVCTTMNAFGNFCDVYYKTNGFTRVVRSSKYKGKLESFVKGFADHKKELEFLMTQKSAATVTQMNVTVGDVSAKVDQVIAFLEVQSRKERAVTRMVEANGGEDVVINNTKLISKIADKFNEKVTPELKAALRADLDEQMKTNFAMFNLKVETAMLQIKDAVERSTDMILTKLNSGPHELIQDEDIRAVWKEMNWRISCKCRPFVDAVHHHYSQIFGQYEIDNKQPHPDKWTLKFLSKVIFYPAIGDAIDEDGSGYLSVYEANQFLLNTPKGWSVPQWLAYWAAGWYQNTIAYRHRCMALLSSIDDGVEKTLPPNKRALKPYSRDQGSLSDIRLIVEAIYTDTLYFHGEETGPEYDALKVLRLERMEYEIKKMKAHLAKPKYQLDSVAGVVAVLGTQRIEMSIMCLLYLLLRRHKKIIDLAQTKILDSQEFSTMEDSVDNVTAAFDLRLNNLLEGWRQQRIDTSLQISCFAGGMYEEWHKKYKEMDSDDEDEWDSDEVETTDDEYDAEKKEAHAADDGDPKDPKDLLVFPLPPQPTPEELERAEKAREAAKARRKEKRARAAAAANTDGGASDGDGPTRNEPGDQSGNESDGYAKKSTYSGYGSDGKILKSGTAAKTGEKAKKGFDAYSDFSDTDEEDRIVEGDSGDSDDDDDSELYDDSDEDDAEVENKRKVSLEDRMTVVEKQLNNIEDLLREVLAISKRKGGARDESVNPASRGPSSRGPSSRAVSSSRPNFRAGEHIIPRPSNSRYAQNLAPEAELPYNPYSDDSDFE